MTDENETIIPLEDGEQVRELANGSWQDIESGKIVKAPTVPNFTDPEQARRAALVRWERAEEQARAGMRRAVEASGRRVASDEEAYGAIIEEQTKLALNSGKGGASTKATELVARHAGMVPSGEQREGGGGPGITVTMSLEAIILRNFERLYPDDPARAMQETALYLANPQGWAAGRRSEDEPSA